MTDMVERVARAINERANKDYNAHMLGKTECMALARAAIEAMREPTSVMVGAMQSAFPTLGHSPYDGISAEDAEDVWRAGVGAMLAKEPHDRSLAAYCHRTARPPHPGVGRRARVFGRSNESGRWD